MQRERSQRVLFSHLLFAEIVNEITLHPRPASHTCAGNVETDHPHAHHLPGQANFPTGIRGVMSSFRALLNYQTAKSPNARRSPSAYDKLSGVASGLADCARPALANGARGLRSRLQSASLPLSPLTPAITSCRHHPYAAGETSPRLEKLQSQLVRGRLKTVISRSRRHHPKPAAGDTSSRRETPHAAADTQAHGRS